MVSFYQFYLFHKSSDTGPSPSTNPAEPRRVSATASLLVSASSFGAAFAAPMMPEMVIPTVRNIQISVFKRITQNHFEYTQQHHLVVWDYSITSPLLRTYMLLIKSHNSNSKIFSIRIVHLYRLKFILERFKLNFRSKEFLV